MKKIAILALIAAITLTFASGCKSEAEKAKDKRMAQVEIVRQVRIEMSKLNIKDRKEYFKVVGEKCRAKGLSDDEFVKLTSYADADAELTRIYSAYPSPQATF